MQVLGPLIFLDLPGEEMGVRHFPWVCRGSKCRHPNTHTPGAPKLTLVRPRLPQPPLSAPGWLPASRVQVNLGPGPLSENSSEGNQVLLCSAQSFYCCVFRQNCQLGFVELSACFPDILVEYGHFCDFVFCL